MRERYPVPSGSGWFIEEFRDGIKLADLAKKHGDSRLIIMGTATTLLNPYSGKLAKWTRVFEGWKERLVMTPKTMDTWTRQENRLEEIFTVIPNHHSILGDWTNTLKNDLDWDKEKWQDTLPPAQTEAIELGVNLISSLNKYYAPPVQLWIAGCAVYPSLHWDLTIHLGHFLVKELEEEQLVSFNHLSSICRLKWFVNGEIPDTARADLMIFLQEEYPILLRKIRQNLNEILENNQPPAYSVAYEEHRMNMAINQLILEDEAKKKKELEDEIIDNLKRGIVGDFDMLKKISRKQLNPLAFQVSDNFAKYIKDEENIIDEKDELIDDEKTKKKNNFSKASLVLLFLLNLIVLFGLYHYNETIHNNCKACNEEYDPGNNNSILEFIFPSCINVNRISAEYDSEKVCITNSKDYFLHVSHKATHQIYSRAAEDIGRLNYLEDLETLDNPNITVDFTDTIVDHSRKVYENIAIAYYNKAVDVYDDFHYEKIKSKSIEEVEPLTW